MPNPRPSIPAPFPGRPLRAAATLLGLLALAVAGSAQDVQTNLVVNGDFATDLGGWLEETHADLTSNWTSHDVADSASSGSAWAGAKEQGHGGDHVEGWIIGQCLEVEPGVHRVAVDLALHPTEHEWGGDYDGHFAVWTTSGPSCSLDPSGDEQRRFAVDEESFEWRHHEELLVVPEGVSRLFVGAWARNWQLGNFREDLHFLVDDVVLGRVRPDVRIVSFTGPAEPVGQLDEIQLQLQVASGANGAEPLARILHGDRLELVDFDCTGNGTITDVAQGALHYFQWSGDSAGPNVSWSRSCTITARTTAGSTGTHSSMAWVDCADCGFDSNTANNTAFVGYTVTAEPDLAPTIDLEALPNRDETFLATVALRNLGNQFTGGTLELSAEYLWGAGAPDFVSSDCDALTAVGGTSGNGQPLVARGELPVDGGATRTCEVTLRASGNAGPLTVWAEAVASTAGDYRPANDRAWAETTVVDLTVRHAGDPGPDVVPGDGICDAGVEPRCSLRAAVQEAMALPGNREVVVPFSETPYRLELPAGGVPGAGGALFVDRRVLITGEPDPGRGGVADLPRIEASFPVGSEDRLFTVDGSSFVRLSHLELVGQSAPPPTGDGYGGHGGLVHHATGSLVLRDVVLRDGATDGHGGAIYSAPGIAQELELDRVRILGSTAAQGGGGLAVESSSLAFVTVVDSEVSANSASSGGGLWVRGASILPVVERSTFDANTAEFYGGGLYLAEAPTTIVRNSTISGNVAEVAGGGGLAVLALFGGEAELEISSSTVVENHADPDDPDSGWGGGIYQGPQGSVTLYNSILAGNTGGRRGEAPFFLPDGANCFGAVDSAGYNSVGPVSADLQCSIQETDGDDFDRHLTLLPLTDNGGPTRTRALAADGLEVDRGDPACRARPGGEALTLDQRGFGRPADGDGDGEARCDKGAWEKGASAGPVGVLFTDGFESGDLGAWVAP